MVEEKLIKSHLIVTDMHEEYHVKWHGKMKDTKPLFKNDLPVFVVISSDKRVELNTTDIKKVENCAKRITHPRGRSAVTTDLARIYIKEEDGKQTWIGTVTHNHVRTYAPMYDKVGWRQ